MLPLTPVTQVDCFSGFAPQEYSPFLCLLLSLFSATCQAKQRTSCRMQDLNLQPFEPHSNASTVGLLGRNAPCKTRTCNILILSELPLPVGLKGHCGKKES